MNILGFEKLLYHPEKLSKIRDDKHQFPVHATISLGNYCNHKCLWCSVYEYQLEKANQINIELLLDWLQRASKRGLKAVGYVGNGEPLGHPRFGELVEAVNSLGIEQGVFTNGYLLDRYEEQMLRCFTYIRISLDAGSSHMHAKMHDVKEGHYDRIIENLKSLLSKRKNSFPTVGIQFAAHHENISDLDNSCKTAREIGANYFSIKPVFNRTKDIGGAVGQRIEKNQLTFEDITPAVSELQKKYAGRGFSIYYRPHQVLSEEVNRNTLKYDRCVAGFFNVNIYEDGSVIYCGPHKISVGNLQDDLDLIENRILKLSKKLNLEHCPSGCRYHGMNHLVDTVINPERADKYHVNFL